VREQPGQQYRLRSALSRDLRLVLFKYPAVGPQLQLA